jgi:hypothetical protein
MSPAERKRRSREQLRASGVKEFSLQVQGMHLEYVELLATGNNISTSEALHGILETALDRYVAVMVRCQAMHDNGATDEQIAKFMHTYWMPSLPAMQELSTAQQDAPGTTDAPTVMGQEVQ